MDSGEVRTMSKPSKELKALRRAVDAYLRQVLVLGSEDAAHRFQPNDAGALGALMTCLRCDVDELCEAVSQREVAATEALAEALMSRQAN